MFRVADYVRGDVTAVATEGSFNTDVYSVSGSNLEMVVTATPRDSVADRAQVLDTLTLRATGTGIGSLAAPTADGTFNVVTFDVADEKVIWTGNPGRSVNENTNTLIALSQYITGLPTNSFDSVSILSKTPDVDWITLENADTTMARLRVNAPSVSMTTQVTVGLRVTKSTANPTTDDITANFTVIDLNPQGATGISVIRYDKPEGAITAGTFVVAVEFSSALGDGDTLVPSDIYVDGLTGVTVDSVAVDPNDNTKYNITLTAVQNIQGVVDIGLVQS